MSAVGSSGKQTELPIPELAVIHNTDGNRLPLPPKEKANCLRQIRFSWKASKVSQVIKQAEEWMVRAGDGLMIGYFGITAHVTTTQPTAQWFYKTSTLLIDIINQKEDTGSLSGFITGLVQNVMKLPSALTTGVIIATIRRTTLDVNETKQDLDVVYTQRETIDYAVKHGGELPPGSMMKAINEIAKNTVKK